MNEHLDPLLSNRHSDEEIFCLLRSIEENPQISQRRLARYLKISLGKINALLHVLVKEGMLEVAKPYGTNGLGAKYILTEKGKLTRRKLNYTLLKKREREYGVLKEEWERRSRP